MTDTPSHERSASPAERRDPESGSTPASSARDDYGRERMREQRALLAAQRRRFGRMRFGVAFFGWLTATGLTVLLTGLITAVADGLGGTSDGGALGRTEAVGVGAGGVIVLILVLLLSYFCGGYVAGRMARFSGLKQGVAVWLWGVVVTAVLAMVGVAVGSQFDLLSRLGALPSISLSGGAALGGVLALLAVTAAALVGALFGGAAGMRFHRRIDQSDASALHTTPTTHPSAASAPTYPQEQS